MGIMRRVSERLAGRFQDREPRRLAASLRQRRRSMRPMAEGLEERSLLSVGLDPSFGLGGAANLNLASTSTSEITFNPSQIALQSGQTVAGGSEQDSLSGTSVLAVARLTTSGSLDTTFDATGIETISQSLISGWKLGAYASGIAVQSNGQIVVLTTATSTSLPTTTDFAVLRLNPNGGLDTSFGNQSGVELFNFGSNWTVDSANALAIGSDGKIVTVGTVFSPSILSTAFGIARLNTNGQLDTTFDSVGSVPGTLDVVFKTPGGSIGNASATGVVVQPTTLGIVAVGDVTPTSVGTNPVSNIAVALLNANGGGALADTLPSYNGNNDDTANGVTLEGTQIVIAGTTTINFAPKRARSPVPSQTSR